MSQHQRDMTFIDIPVALGGHRGSIKGCGGISFPPKRERREHLSTCPSLLLPYLLVTPYQTIQPCPRPSTPHQTEQQVKRASQSTALSPCMHLNRQATGVIGTLEGMGKLSEWLTRKQRPDDDIVSKGVVWNARGEMQSCIFCDFANHTKEKELLYEDDLVIAFSPLKPAAKQHILVVPKRHISTVGDLVETDTPLLDRMKEVAVKLIKCDAAQTQLSFHIPPWNSVGKCCFRVTGGPKVTRSSFLFLLRHWETAAAAVCFPDMKKGK